MNIVKNVLLCTVLLLSTLHSCLSYGMEPTMAPTTVPTEQVDIFEAIEMGNISRACELIAAGVNVNRQDEKKQTPLHCAAQLGLIKIVEMLINAGAQTTAQNIDGNTPLHLAAGNFGADDYRNQVAVIGVLIDHGADVNALNIDGDSPLHLAAEVGNAPAVKALIMNDADVNLQNKIGNYPLNSALLDWYDDHSAVAKILIAAGARLDAQNIKGQTPLIFIKDREKGARLAGQQSWARAHAMVNLLTEYEQRITIAPQKAKEKAKEALYTLALAMHHERLGQNSPVATLSQYVLQELAPHIIQLTTETELYKARQPRAQVIAHTLAMGQHGHLGANSPLAMLPQELLRHIIHLAIQPEGESCQSEQKQS